jgi:hypothetical protein
VQGQRPGRRRAVLADQAPAGPSVAVQDLDQPLPEPTQQRQQLVLDLVAAPVVLRRAEEGLVLLD